MTIRVFILTVLTTLVFNGCRCTKEVDCADRPIYPAFIGFSASEIDTFVIRKFYPNNNYQQQIDTFLITYNSYYQTSNDTTKVALYQRELSGIVAGYDWQLFLPATQKTVYISEIIGNKKTEHCGTLAFDPFCSCVNDFYSAKQGNQTITFTNSDTEQPFLYIHK